MGLGTRAKYESMIDEGSITQDPVQSLAVDKLQKLADEMKTYSASSNSGLSWLFSKKNNKVPTGLYIHGGVGRGKSMMMDLFFDTVAFKKKRRVHFHEFMAEIHDSIAAFRKSHDGDPIPLVADKIAETTKLLCFDEFHVTDIADAMILGRLFTRLFENGLVVVATSNVAPDNLYKDGLNRQLFLPFIDLLKQKAGIFVVDTKHDYRLAKLENRQIYFTPIGAQSKNRMRKIFHELTGVDHGNSTSLTVKGRTLNVPEAHQGTAWFTFDDLCDKPLAAVDYLAISDAFHTVMIEGIPVLGPKQRNQARRFNTLIDTLYDREICLVATAEAEPHDLYPEGDGAELFKRTASRLMEMRSEAYLSKLPMETV